MIFRTFKLIDPENNHSKFWAIETSDIGPTGPRVTCRWGRIGTKGQKKTFDFDNLSKRNKFVARKIAEKLSEGYVEVTAAATATHTFTTTSTPSNMPLEAVNHYGEPCRASKWACPRCGGPKEYLDSEEKNGVPGYVLCWPCAAQGVCTEQENDDSGRWLLGDHPMTGVVVDSGKMLTLTKPDARMKRDLDPDDMSMFELE